jgi:hypothetical protein
MIEGVSDADIKGNDRRSPSAESASYLHAIVTWFLKETNRAAVRRQQTIDFSCVAMANSRHQLSSIAASAKLAERMA